MAVAAGVIPSATMIVGDDPALVYNALDNFSQKVEAKVGSDLERITLQGGGLLNFRAGWRYVADLHVFPLCADSA